MEYVVKYLSPDICVETDSAWGNYKNLARERLPELSPFNKRMIMSELKQHSAPILAHQTVLLFSVRKNKRIARLPAPSSYLKWKPQEKRILELNITFRLFLCNMLPRL
ncbi:hypothetical protein CDAR_491751 [Caerostris darwini]|uniref:Transposase n=1 Tax=Caerostris darwini TaxID=1538125 RepID=A0AAV4MZR6_9ARAC|nr:hypothetical protein CDAR_491751 [Caerostris darwini]